MAGRFDELADLIGQTMWGKQGAAPAQPAAPPNGQPDFSTLGGRAAYLFGSNAGLPPAGFQPPAGATPALDDALRANGAMLNTPSAPPAVAPALAAVAAAPANKTVPDVSSKGVQAAAAQGIDPRYAALAEAGNHLNAGMMLQLAAVMHPQAMHDQMLAGMYNPIQKQFFDNEARISQMPDAATRNAAQLENIKGQKTQVMDINGILQSLMIQRQNQMMGQMGGPLGLPSIGNPGLVGGQ